MNIWCNAQLPSGAVGELEAGCGRHRLILSGEATGNLAAGEASDSLEEAQIAFGQPDPDQIIRLSGLDWVQLTSAGYTRYDRADIQSALGSRGAVLTNSSSVYDEPCAQHLVSLMLAHARRIPQAVRAQVEGRGWIFDELRNAARVLESDTVLILGFGAIARCVCRLLAPFGVRVVAVRRKVLGDEPIPVYEADRLDELLPTADHILSTLPANYSTDLAMSARRFSIVKPSAVFYNVGRGSTVDQEALVGALESGRLGGAYLDVADPEPLPKGHPLWTAPNCWITPHIAGGCQDEHGRLVRHFLRNLRRYETGEPLADRVFGANKL